MSGATVYHYKAVGPDGKPRLGTLAGESEKAVAQQLRRQGLTPVYIGQRAPQGPRFKWPQWRQVRRKDVLLFTQELATLLSAGVPVDRALSISCDLTERPAFRAVIQDVLRVLKGGKSLAESLATQPAYFGELYVNMVRAGEASGELAEVFERLADFERRRDELRGYIISSLIYPGLLTLVGLGSIVILLYFVVPRFAAVFAESRMRIPVPTMMLLAASAWVKAYGGWVLLGAAAAAAGVRGYIQTREGRIWWDRLRLRVPLLGESLRKAETARFAQAMATLVANAVPLVQSIQIAAAILNNKIIAGSLEAVAQGVKRGEGLATPLRRTGQFPPLAAHLLSVGEETGRLDAMFARMAEIYEKDTRESIKRFTALFEPIIILVMGVMVGALILSMMLAITSINEVAV